MREIWYDWVFFFLWIYSIAIKDITQETIMGIFWSENIRIRIYLLNVKHLKETGDMTVGCPRSL